MTKYHCGECVCFKHIPLFVSRGLCSCHGYFVKIDEEACDDIELGEFYEH